MDPAISEFIQERKSAWLKKKHKPNMSEHELEQLESECDAVFDLADWLPKAAKRAGQISISTHPCTFSHPSAKKNKNGDVSAVIAEPTYENDGFLRSGNVGVEKDALGNAAALDVYKFLLLKMQDGQTLLSHLKDDTSLARSVLRIPSADYSSLRGGFLAMMENAEVPITSSKIKQVYFPVGDSCYHLLSILSPSAMMFEMRRRLDQMRFSEQSKQARDKRRKGEYSDDGYREIYGLVTMGFGGTKPQNISVLNNQNGGRVHLLRCEPPRLTRRETRFPSQNFFKQSLNAWDCKSTYYKIHGLYQRDRNNRRVREGIEQCYLSVLDYVISCLWAVRSVAPEQYREETSELPDFQRYWLVATNNPESKPYDLSPVIEAVVRFVRIGYEKVLGNKAVLSGDQENNELYKLIEKSSEALR